MTKTAVALGVAAGAALHLVVLSTHAAAQRPTAVTPAVFVTRAAVSDMFETQSSELAAIKADAPTRAFAAQMNAAHQKTASELGVIVKGRAADLPLPPRLDPPHQQRLDQLMVLKGPAFTTRYHAEQVQAHGEAIALFETFAASGGDERLRQWAAHTLPTLKEHLEHAKALAMPARP
jgi:putative membrane protein